MSSPFLHVPLHLLQGCSKLCSPQLLWSNHGRRSREARETAQKKVYFLINHFCLFVNELQPKQVFSKRLLKDDQMSVMKHLTQSGC